MDILSVINLGHSANVPLISCPSELVDGLEPHDMFYLQCGTVPAGVSVMPVPGVYPGWRELGGYRRVLYRVLS